MAIKFYSLGAAEEVTGSKHILEVDGHKYLIDCGAFQGKRAEADKKNRDFNVPASELEAVILTHAHYDHCGLLPLLGKHGFNGNIYATPATRDIANLVMMDSARIQARDREYLSKQAAKKGESFKWVPLFDEKDVIQTVNQFVTISYHRPTWIGPNVQLEFYDAGHILGSAMAVITAKDSEGKEVKIAFTGDLGRKNKAIIRDPDIIPPVDYIVIESTYGNRRHEETDNALKLLAEKTKELVENKGKMIIPAFAVERTQEIVYYFHLLVDKKIIPDIPIYVDSPMAVNATSIFQVHPECYDAETHEAFLTHHKNPFGFNSLKFITSVSESKDLNNIDGPMVIISADGMCEFGRITHHLANNIEKPSTKIMLVGFMAEDTLGRRLQNREQEVKIFGEWHQVRAEILQINAFSAHADYFEAEQWLDSLENPKLKTIFLVHGEPKAQSYFTQYLNENGYKDVKTVKYGETYNLD
ncbi:MULTISPECIES: MBL fold metallo-hydrolase RNA specificity domain-containing protein [unclassified Treponema]|uniref:MBL fold metallo-hydrolase RNA specificity domain-containing protein n=1 Tax=unclassified Treponema TaxID=2638727 RepID=UPI0020A2CBB2|nr:MULTISPECIES: MBL fold metallo-hydrolase [unclassified Treponema]UTC68184.1 MBL fold metallo-hydrolase [Treponema sp. OMZ 789]UTC70904.1 MBL fold metallo-hydrolase [Treponema sp. OMZ 790]UTC73644.1 MBL fold metallo-hydrolase [Treponema sp. OMZ 791]